MTMCPLRKAKAAPAEPAAIPAIVELVPSSQIYN
jgi:hypothetical protein